MVVVKQPYSLPPFFFFVMYPKPTIGYYFEGG